MSGTADPLVPVSAKRLHRKTREDELLFPVMSDPLMQMDEASKDEKADNWMVTLPHPKQMLGVPQMETEIEVVTVIGAFAFTFGLPPFHHEDWRDRPPLGYSRRKLKSKCVQSSQCLHSHSPLPPFPPLSNVEVCLFQAMGTIMVQVNIGEGGSGVWGTSISISIYSRRVVVFLSSLHFSGR